MFAAKSKFGGRAKRVSTNLQENAMPESFVGRKYVFNHPCVPGRSQDLQTRS